MNFLEEIQKVGLTPELYEECIQDIQDKLNGVKDLEWEEIKTKYNLNMKQEHISITPA